MKIISANKSGHFPPKIFSGNNNSNLLNETNNNKSLQESKIYEDFTNNNIKNNNLDDYFNVLPDNSVMNISALTNNIVIKENSRLFTINKPNFNYNIRNASDIYNNGNKIDNSMISIMDTSVVNFTINKNQNFEVAHDSAIDDLDYTYNNKFNDPKIEDKDESIGLNEPSVDFKIEKEPEEKIEITQSKQIEEPVKIQESFFEETFFEDDIRNFKIFNPVEIENSIKNKDLRITEGSFKRDKNCLTDLFGNNLISTWAKISIRKIALIKKGIKDDRYYTRSFIQVIFIVSRIH